MKRLWFETLDRSPEAGGALTEKFEEGTQTLDDAFEASSFRVGKYEVVGEIGRGGMGVVFRARDTELGREVAIKRPLAKAFENRRARRRFTREARTASQLLHPNAVTIFEVVEQDDVPYLVMELIDGRRLSAVVKTGGALSIEKTVRYGEGIASALVAAHKLKILHRDVNPNNVLLDSEGRARLTDFGIARLVDEPKIPGMTVTREGMIVGTRGYMSPEQALGKKLDHRTDIFNLGLLLYEMAGGHAAFPTGETDEWIGALLHDDPAPLEGINPNIPEELDFIIRKALQKEPEDRYQSAREMRDDLRGLRQSVESEVFTAPTYADRRREKRHRWIWAVAALAIGAGLGWGWKVLLAPSVLPGGMAWSPRQLTTDPGWESEPVISPDGTMVAYTSDRSGNADIWLMDAKGGDALQLTDHPAADRSPTWLPDNSALLFVSERLGTPGIWRIPRLGGTPVEIIEDGEDPAVSPDGLRVSFSRLNATADRRILVAPLAEPFEARWLTGPDDHIQDHREPAWSPDGTQLVYNAWGALHVIPAEGGPSRRLTETSIVTFNPVWSPVTDQVYFSSNSGGTLALWRVLASGGAIERMTMGTGSERHPSVDLAGQRVVYATFSGNVDILILDRTAGITRRLPGGKRESLPALAPDGGSLVFVSDREGPNKLWLQDLVDGKPFGASRRLTTDDATLAVPSYSPDGRWIAGHRRGKDADIWILSVDDGRPIRFTGAPGEDFHPAWSPDGATLAFVSEENGFQHVWITPIQDGVQNGNPVQLTFGETANLFPTWFPDGEQIAFVRLQGTEGDIWSVQTNAPGEVRRLTHGAQASQVHWDPRSSQLLVSGRWNEGIYSLRFVSPIDGSTARFDGAVDYGSGAEYGDFSLSGDGRYLAWSQTNASGDIWIAQTAPGSL